MQSPIANEPSTLDVNVRLIVVIGIVSILLLLECVVGIQALYNWTEQEETTRKDVSQPSWGLNDLLFRQQAELHSYGWVDRPRGIVAIPIDVAMKRYVQRQATQPWGDGRAAGR